MALFSAIAILGLTIQTFAYNSINAAIVGRGIFGISAGVFFVMAPKIIQENTVKEDFETRWSPFINTCQRGLRLGSVFLLKGEVS